MNGEDNLLFLDQDINNLKGQYTRAILKFTPEEDPCYEAMPAWTEFYEGRESGPEALRKIAALYDYQREAWESQAKVAEQIYDSLAKLGVEGMESKDVFLLQVWKDSVLLVNTLKTQLEKGPTGSLTSSGAE